ncbi:MAG: recombinase family protein [Deltaproteobacteria bacterium]|nr:recombinase family protein [Deltaproteobacteria bacterium]
MNVRTYCRRSKNDEGKQQFSLDVQAAGCAELIERMDLGAAPTLHYVDDGRSGDDFHTRSGLRQLLADAKRGDVIVCRDQSRLGRDAIEVTLVVRDLVRDRGCRLYYYATGQEVLFATAIDQATTFIQGTGHQMELEAIRSRTREALRSRVRDGRIAGGSCFGYTLERKSDGTGRRYTIAVVNDEEAAIVRRIFELYLDDHGHKAIAHQLNNEGVRAPSAGRRGSGSWAPGAVRTVLLNARYRGVYVHGRIKKVRQGGATIRAKADPHEVLTVEVPEWRVVDDETWFAVQERFGSKGPRAAIGRPPARYALTGLAKCAHCGGAILSARTRVYGGGKERVKVYACSRHHQRGSAVCPVTVYQRMDDVEGALVEYISRNVLTERVLDEVLAEIRVQIEAQLPKREADVSALESELRDVRAEQRRLAKAVALADDVPELVSELRQRSTRIQFLESQILAAKKTPDELAKLVKQIERTSRVRLADLRAALADETDRREAFLALFPDGLTFTAARTPGGERQIWKITGDVDLGSLTDAAGSKRITTRPPANDSNTSDPTARNSTDGGGGSKRIATPTGRAPIGRGS